MNTDTPVQDAPGVLTEIKALAMPDMAMVNRGAASALRMAESFVIASDDDYQLAGEELQSVKGRLKKLEEQRTSITGPMNKALDATNAMFKVPKAALESAETAIKASMLTYYNEQQRIADEARRKAEAEAEAERQRLAEEARKVEQAAAAERKKIADQAAAAAAAAQAEQNRLAQEAAAALESGNQAAANAAQQAIESSRLQSELDAQQAEQRDIEVSTSANESTAALRVIASVAAAPAVGRSTVKSSGISVRTSVDFEVTSLLSLVQHVAKHPDHINLLMVDSVKLRGLVKGLGLNTNLPGVRVYSKSAMASKAA